MAIALSNNSGYRAGGDAPLERPVPYDLQAEEAALGSLLLDRDAIIKVATFLQPADFYREANGWIYDCILDLYHRREPPDLVTLSSELDRRGRLEPIGGLAYLAGLMHRVPTAVHVEYYGRIVERTAVLRRLISVGGQIAGLGYEEGLDLGDVLDRAESLLFGVTQRQGSQDFLSIKRVLEEYFDRLDTVQHQRGNVVGVPTGFHDLDELTGGLQRSDLVIVAARPSVGKSSFGMSIAYNASVLHRKSVGIFSLEMSAEQLVQRLLAIASGVEAQRLRLGYLNDTEWQKLSDAFGLLADVPLFFDDSAGLTITEVRSRARRLQAEAGCDLLIVDYLQLMSGKRSENRVQEVSEITRGLKQLARELNVPVIAISQLSRAVESRTSHVPMLSDLRESGCLAGETPVFLPEQGVYRPIAELVGQAGFSVLALDPATGQLAPCPVTRAFSTGRKPVYRLTTRQGRSLRATANHPFLTPDGWRRLDALQPGGCLALARRLPVAAGVAEGPAPDFGIEFYQPNHGCERTARLAQIVKSEQLYRLVPVRSLDGAGPPAAGRPADAALWAPADGAPQYAYIGQPILHAAPKETAALAPRSAPLPESASGQPDVYWDEIVSIRPDGETDVYDLTVGRLHNFVAAGMIVHNSIEQDADIVMFIYREELYNPETERKNIAEIHVAKHRNGPIGVVPLFFQNTTTHFADLEVYRQPS